MGAAKAQLRWMDARGYGQTWRGGVRFVGQQLRSDTKAPLC